MVFVFRFLEKVYALFRPHFYKSIFALVLVDCYILIKILCMNDEGDILK